MLGAGVVAVVCLVGCWVERWGGEGRCLVFGRGEGG